MTSAFPSITLENMNVITIPRKLIKNDDLVIIPRREYQEFSHWKKTVKARPGERWFWTPEWQKKEREADEAIHTGKVRGPFSDHRTLLAALKRKQK